MRYYTDENIKIIIKGKSKLPDDWQDYMDKIIIIFDDVHKQNPNIVFEYDKDWLNEKNNTRFLINFKKTLAIFGIVWYTIIS